MAPPVFPDQENPPTEERLLRAVGSAGGLWTGLCRALPADCPPASTEWNFYSAKYGRTLFLKQKSRTLAYLPDKMLRSRRSS